LSFTSTNIVESSWAAGAGVASTSFGNDRLAHQTSRQKMEEIRLISINHEESNKREKNGKRVAAFTHRFKECNLMDFHIFSWNVT